MNAEIIIIVIEGIRSKMRGTSGTMRQRGSENN